jgi:hypothetical protein
MPSGDPMPLTPVERTLSLLHSYSNTGLPSPQPSKTTSLHSIPLRGPEDTVRPCPRTKNRVSTPRPTPTFTVACGPRTTTLHAVVRPLRPRLLLKRGCALHCAPLWPVYPYTALSRSSPIGDNLVSLRGIQPQESIMIRTPNRHF